VSAIKRNPKRVRADREFGCEVRRVPPKQSDLIGILVRARILCVQLGQANQGHNDYERCTLIQAAMPFAAEGHCM
jgi:hypothetical protein